MLAADVFKVLGFGRSASTSAPTSRTSSSPPPLASPARAGKRDQPPDQRWPVRLVFRLIVSVVALRLLWQGHGGLAVGVRSPG